MLPILNNKSTPGESIANRFEQSAVKVCRIAIPARVGRTSGNRRRLKRELVFVSLILKVEEFRNSFPAGIELFAEMAEY